jgi:diguanylate cyclase (GGDEF)-like protein
VLRGTLAAADFEHPVTPARRAELDSFFAEHVLEGGVLLVEVYAADGTVTYSTDHRLIGTRDAATAHRREALGGTIRGDVTRLARDPAGTRDRKVLRTYAPVAVAGGAGVVAVFQDYAPIAAAAKAAFVPVAGVFEGALVVLFAVLAPILRRVTVRIRRQMEEIEYRGLYDALTRLPNRTLFADRCEQAVRAAERDGGTAVVMLLDVDRFKEVNDALGHESGDALIGALAERLQGGLRASETLARLGGDEFGVLLPRASLEDAALVAERIHRSLQTPFRLESIPLEIAASVGLALYPDHGTQVDELLRHADVALYMAKEAHGGTAVYDPEQDTSDAVRLALASELRAAIDDGDLVVYFQPKALLSTGAIVGAEALVRWQHPERGLVPPNDFIPVAERTGLIRPLSRYVLGAAVRQCAAWRAEGIDIHVAVNLTIPDLLDLELPGRLRGLLDETGVEARCLELEITESTILADPFRVRQVLAGLNELGVRLAIDDFGTGYSSLAYLRRLPVQTIKIDRSFVMTMEENASDRTIVRSTIDLGRNLGLDVVAEGVESQAAWDSLREQGCSLAQGYFVSRPLPPAELAGLLAERARIAGASAAALP